MFHSINRSILLLNVTVVVALIVVLIIMATTSDVKADVMPLTSDFTKAESGEQFPGGDATVRKSADGRIFTHPSSNMNHEKKLDFFVGFGLFRKNWVQAPATTAASDGLGPLYNARSCQTCHIRDGRGNPPDDGDNAVSMFLRLSIPPQTEDHKKLLSEHKINTIPEPTYGGQLQNIAVSGQSGEGDVRVKYEPVEVIFPDGEKVLLRKPTYSVDNLGYGNMHADVMLSPRIAPPMIGLGLLEAINEKDILSLADSDDSDKDGISGKPNKVWSKLTNSVSLGKFGYKAGQPNLDEQNQGAAFNDIGLSVPLHPNGWGACTEAQNICRKAPDGGSPQYNNLEAPKRVTDALNFYISNLAVPIRRKANDKEVLSGKALFYSSGCTACHQPSFKTAKKSETSQLAGLSNQLIWPYTDLLLHDMGKGLSDNRPEGDASGNEWRTSPLWGVGLAKTVNKRAMFLHDGRARNIQEAILWHDGEARYSKGRFMSLKKGQRAQLLMFIESL